MKVSGSYQDWESRITLKRIKDKIDKKWRNSEKSFSQIIVNKNYYYT